MAISIHEGFKSRELTDGESHERIYVILGTDDEGAALAALKTEAPSTSHGLTRGDCSVEPLAPYGGLIPGAWLGTAPYQKGGSASVDQLALGEIAIRYDTGGGQQHITQSILTVSTHAPQGKTATDHKGAIGVTKDSVEGCDIGAAQFRFTATKVFEVGDLPDPNTLAALTYRVNDDTFAITDSRTGQTLTFSYGECLLTGVSGPTMREDGYAELAYSFAASGNQTDITIGDITGIAKQGWHYLWAQYEETKDDSAKRLATRPIAAYVEKVYHEGDFSNLGL